MRERWCLIAMLAACGNGNTAAVDASDLFDAEPPDGPPDAPPPWPACSACGCTSTGLVPLTDLGAGTYQGVIGGLYPGGENLRPAAHEADGLAAAQAIGPLDTGGAPSAGGRYVLVSIGMSNTTQEFSAFLPMTTADAARDPRLTVVDGAQGSQTSTVWADPQANAWSVLDQRLTAAGVTRQQVVVAWVKLARANPMGTFPADINPLVTEMGAVARNLKARFPNLRLTYWSSRIYAGYATGVSMLNPEPYAYQGGFAVKRIIDGQLAGDPMLSPPATAWAAWGPYLWADGTSPRGDGLSWACSDLAADGTHPAVAGRTKVAQALFDFVHTDTTAREWYLASP